MTTSKLKAISEALAGEEEFVIDVVTPMTEVTGLEYELVKADNSDERDALAAKVLHNLLTKEAVEIAIFARWQRPARQILDHILAQLKKNDDTLEAKIIKHNIETVWFQFGGGPGDVRKLSCYPRSARTLKGVSANVLYVVAPEVKK